MMERKQLEYFLAVATHGSFTAAANSLHVAQPSLSYAIRTLEREVGTPLFRRVGRGVVLTPMGDALRMPAQQVLRDFARLQTTAQSVTELISGRLDIVAVTTLAVDPLAEFAGTFRTRYPGVELSVADPENAAAVVDMVRRGECEIGFTEHGIDATGLNVYDLPKQEVFAVLPPNTSHPAATPMPVDEFAELDLVTTPQGTTTRSLADEVLARAGAPARIAVEITHRAAIIPLVLTGAGATLLPKRLADDAANLGAIVTRLDPPITRHGVVLTSAEPLSAAARAFVNMITEWNYSDL